MIIDQRDIDIPKYDGNDSIIDYFERQIKNNIDEGEIPLRFGITKTDNNKYKCELGVLRTNNSNLTPAIESSIF